MPSITAYAKAAVGTQTFSQNPGSSILY